MIVVAVGGFGRAGWECGCVGLCRGVGLSGGVCVHAAQFLRAGDGDRSLATQPVRQQCVSVHVHIRVRTTHRPDTDRQKMKKDLSFNLLKDSSSVIVYEASTHV